jgi:GAF domain-containing protein
MDGSTICRDLSRRVEEGASFADILEQSVRLLHALSPRFYWTGIYELFPDNTLRLGPFVGPPTNHVFIGVGQGVCGTAVAERRNMNIPDVTRVTNYLACSAETRSELVVLIRSGETIHAQIDIDSHEIAAFDEGIEALVQEVADFLARLYDGEARRRAA